MRRPWESMRKIIIRSVSHVDDRLYHHSAGSDRILRSDRQKRGLHHGKRPVHRHGGTLQGTVAVPWPFLNQHGHLFYSRLSAGLNFTARGIGQGSFIVFIFILPMWMNFLLRTLAWQTLLEKNGVINGVLSALHLPPQGLINTGRHYPRHGVQLPAVYGSAYL